MGDPLRNRDQLKGRGAIKAMEKSHDEAWEAGFKAGIAYQKIGRININDIEKVERITNAKSE
jgi:hypothetical protein